MLEQTTPLLNKIDLLLTEQDVLRSGPHDAVAEAAMQSVIKFGNKTEDWQETLRLLEIAIPIAGGAAQRVRMEENRKTAQTNHKSNCCYFCNISNPDPEKAVEVKMYGDVERTPNYYTNTVEITWRHITIKVPRCKKCASIHDKSNNIFIKTVFLVVIITAFAPFIETWVKIEFSIERWLDRDFLIVGFLYLITISTPLGILAGQIAISFLANLNCIKSVRNTGGFTTVKELISQGWRYGEKPNIN